MRAMVRRAGGTGLPSHERLEVVTADMRDEVSLRAAVKGVAAVVHLAAAKSDEKDSDDVNVGGAKRLVAVCRADGCERVVNVSTLSVKIARKGTYARTKAEADKVFQASGLKVTTLLSNIVYGEEKSGVFGTVSKFVQKLPAVPVLGDGQWVCAPVYIGDVSDAIIACLETDATVGKSYDLAGPDQMSFDTFIDRLSAELEVHRPKVHIPFAIALMMARILCRVMPHPPITVSNVLGSNQCVPMDTNPARRDFGFAPLDFQTGLKVVLGKIANPRAGAGGSGD